MIGPDGSGKSTVLNQVVLFARQRNWLVMFIPNGWHQSQEGYFVDPITLENGDIVYDNQIMTVDILRGFWTAHHDILAGLILQNVNALPKYDKFINSFRVEGARVLSVPGKIV
jgi:hypothetical protein